MPDNKVKLKGVLRIWTHDGKTGKELSFEERKNIVVTVGKESIARRMTGDTTKANTSEYTFGAVGTGTNAPAVGDTQLQTEIFRKLFALRTRSANKAIFRLFLATGEANGTLKEFAIFGEDADVSADSGTMLNRVNIDKVKTNAITLTLEAEITVG